MCIYLQWARGAAAVAQLIRPRTRSFEIPGSNLQAAVVPLGKALYPTALSLREYVCPLVAVLVAR